MSPTTTLEATEAAAEKAAAAAKAKVLKLAKAKEAAEAKAKEKKAAKAKAQIASAFRTLQPYAKEISIRLEKADRMEDDAYDHRLAAALQLAKAREIAKEAGVGFGKWCEDVVGRPYNTVRKLVTVGASEDPALALEDLRGRNKDYNKKARVKAKTSREVSGAPAKAETPSARVISGFKALKDTEEGAKLAKSFAESYGFKAVTTEEAKAARLAHEAVQHGPYDQIVALFDGAATAVKMQVVNYVVEAVGASLADGFAAPITPSNGAGEGDGLDTPEYLKREVKKGSRRKGAAA